MNISFTQLPACAQEITEKWHKCNWKWSLTAGAGTDDMTRMQVGFYFFTLYMCSTKHVWIIYISNDCAVISNSNTQTVLGLKSPWSHPWGTRFMIAWDWHRDIKKKDKQTKKEICGNSSNTNLVLGRERKLMIKHFKKRKMKELVQRLVLFASSACWRGWGGWWRLRCHLQSLICQWKSSSLRPSALPVLSLRVLEPPSCTYVNRPTWLKDVSLIIK